MNYQVMNRVFAYSRAVGSQRMLLLAVARYADERGIAWPSYRALGECMNLSPRQVQRLVHAAEQSGELAVVWRAASGRPNLYVLLCGLPEEQVQALRARTAALNQLPAGRELAQAFRLTRRAAEQSGLLDSSASEESLEGGDILAQRATFASAESLEGGDILAQRATFASAESLEGGDILAQKATSASAESLEGGDILVQRATFSASALQNTASRSAKYCTPGTTSLSRGYDTAVSTELIKIKNTNNKRKEELKDSSSWLILSGMQNFSRPP